MEKLHKFLTEKDIEKIKEKSFKAGQESKEAELMSNPVCRFQNCMNGTLYCEKHSWKQSHQDFAEAIKKTVLRHKTLECNCAKVGACASIIYDELEELAKKAGDHK